MCLKLIEIFLKSQMKFCLKFIKILMQFKDAWKTLREIFYKIPIFSEAYTYFKFLKNYIILPHFSKKSGLIFFYILLAMLYYSDFLRC